MTEISPPSSVRLAELLAVLSLATDLGMGQAMEHVREEKQMTTFSGTVTEQVEADPDELFGLITDIDRLPEWNEHILHVVEAPGQLAEGSEWVIEMRAMGTKWNSRSRFAECDPAARRFAYVTRTDDGNPSRAYWTWNLSPIGNGTRIAVEWELHPKTFWRRTLFARIRNRQLKHEVRASIGALATAVGSRPGA